MTPLRRFYPWQSARLLHELAYLRRALAAKQHELDMLRDEAVNLYRLHPHVLDDADRPAR